MDPDKELEETMAANSEWKGSADTMWQRFENQITSRQQRRKWHVPAWGAAAAALLLFAFVGAKTLIPGSHPAPSGTSSGAPSQVNPGITSSAPPGADAQILASYPAEVQAAVKESQPREGARSVTVGDDLWIIVTAGNQPGAAVTIDPVVNQNGTVNVVYSVQPLSGIVSSTGLYPQPYNVMRVEGAGKAKVTFRKAKPTDQ